MTFSQAERLVMSEMGKILDDPEATDDELEAAALTVAEVVSPGKFDDLVESVPALTGQEGMAVIRSVLDGTLAEPIQWRHRW